MQENEDIQQPKRAITNNDFEQIIHFQSILDSIQNEMILNTDFSVRFKYGVFDQALPVSVAGDTATISLYAMFCSLEENKSNGYLQAEWVTPEETGTALLTLVKGRIELIFVQGDRIAPDEPNGFAAFRVLLMKIYPAVPFSDFYGFILFQENDAAVFDVFAEAEENRLGISSTIIKDNLAALGIEKP